MAESARDLDPSGLMTLINVDLTNRCPFDFVPVVDLANAGFVADGQLTMNNRERSELIEAPDMGLVDGDLFVVVVNGDGGA